MSPTSTSVHQWLPLPRNAKCVHAVRPTEMEYVKENIVWEYVDCHADYDTTLVSGRCGNAEWDVRPSTRGPFDSSKESASRSPILLGPFCCHDIKVALVPT